MAYLDGCRLDPCNCEQAGHYEALLERAKELLGKIPGGGEAKRVLFYDISRTLAAYDSATKEYAGEPTDEDVAEHEARMEQGPTAEQEQAWDDRDDWVRSGGADTSET